MTILSKGNAKLDRSCFIYSHTPVVGCGPWCKDCAKTCYAMNSYKQYKNVKAKWDANLALSKTNNFYAAFCKELKERKVKKVRLMQAGDFYNDSIINKFYYIIRDNPQVTFYGYTKNKRAYDKLNKLLNCNIIYSFVNGFLNYGSEEYCKLLHKKFGCHICSLNEEAGEKCMRDCDVCMRKSSAKTGVCFVIHGTKKGDRSYENSVIEKIKKIK